MQDVKEIISVNINKYLNKVGMKKSELAAKLNISKSSVGTWCTGSTSPALNIIPDICEALGITINELFSMPNDNEITSSEFELLQRYRNASITKQNVIIELLKED